MGEKLKKHDMHRSKGLVMNAEDKMGTSMHYWNSKQDMTGCENGRD